MNIKCIKNKHNEKLYTVGNTYTINKSYEGYFGGYAVSSNLMYIFADHDIMDKIVKKKIGRSFYFMDCKFRVVK